MSGDIFIAGPPRRTRFDQRIALAEEHELAVQAMFDERGWTCDRFGQAMLTERMRKALRATQSPARWTPDLIACQGTMTILVEVKASTRTDTSNWSIEVASYDAATRFQDALGHRVIYVWHDYTANFHDDLAFVNTEPWGDEPTSGSGTPYWLVRKDDQLPLDDVLAWVWLL